MTANTRPDPEYHEHVAGDKHSHPYNGPHSHGGVSALYPPTDGTTSKATSAVLAHVLTERNIQRERYSETHDAGVRPEEWDALIGARLDKPGSRYVRLVQVAALAVAAAERLASKGEPE